jgi:hypothetical protein
MELAVTMKVTPSATIFWRNHRTPQQLIAAIFDHHTNLLESIRATENEAAAAHITLNRARATIAVNSAIMKDNTIVAENVKVLDKMSSFAAMEPILKAFSSSTKDSTESMLIRSRRGR